MEHAVPEQMFNIDSKNPPDAISAVKALAKAITQGQRVYRITQANQSALLPNIHHDNDTMSEIKNALNAGKEVITHTDAVSVLGWSGAGYIITDPDTGAGAYKIAGGGNGGFFFGLGYIISVLELFYDALTSLASTLGSKIPILHTVSNFLKIAKFTQNILENGIRCNDFGPLSIFMTLTALFSILIVELITSLANPLAAFAFVFILDKSFDWLINQTPDCMEL